MGRVARRLFHHNLPGSPPSTGLSTCTDPAARHNAHKIVKIAETRSFRAACGTATRGIHPAVSAITLHFVWCAPPGQRRPPLAIGRGHLLDNGTVSTMRGLRLVRFARDVVL